VLVVGIPLFVRMPLCCDVIFFDVCARDLLDGGLLYRDIAIVGPPTTCLLHGAARAIVGWSMEAIHGVDLLIVSSIVALLAGRLLPGLSGWSRTGCVGFAAVLFLFYFSTSEWCHAQPDVWMLLPAVGALCLRCRQVDAVLSGASVRDLAKRSLFEGALWGVSFSMKPFAGLAALACLALTAAVAWRAGGPARKRLALDAGGVLLGGLVVGVALLAWLGLSGNWPYFAEAQRTAPDFQEYYARAAGWDSRVTKLFTRLWPWNLVNALALPLALVILVRVLTTRPAEALRRQPLLLAQAMLAACYLAWFTQANFVQHQFDYHLVSPILLGLTLLASQEWLFRPRFVRFAVLPGVLAWFVVVHPLSQFERLSAWPRCWKGGSPELRERLGSLEKDAGFLSTWTDLDRVAQFLKKSGVRDGELTCLSNSSLALYSELRLRPSNRYVMLSTWAAYLPQRYAQIQEEVRAGPQKYIVIDLEENLSIPHAQAPRIQELPAAIFRSYPWNQPLLFRAGRYVVLRASHDGAPEAHPAPSTELAQATTGGPSLRTAPALLARLAATLALMGVCAIGPGLFFVCRLRWRPAETLCASLGLTYVLIYLCTLVIYVLDLPNAAHYGVTAACLLLTFLARHDLFRLLRRPRLRKQIGGFAFLLAWGALLIGLVRHFSGGAGSFDWLEHYERAAYFLHVDRYYDFFRVSGSVAARPPVLNMVASHYMAQLGTDYPVFQAIDLFLSCLVYFPLCLMARYFAGRQRYPGFLLVGLLALSPMLWWNTTFTWTKVFTCFYVILGLWFYLRGWHKQDGRRMTAAFVALSAGFLVHYSAGPYAFMLGLHYLACVLPWRRDRWREAAAVSAGSALLLATWFLPSITLFGRAATFGSNTTAQAFAASSAPEVVGRALVNGFYTLVPHPLRIPPDQLGAALELEQRSGLGSLRDQFISVCGGNVLLNMGCVGGFLVAYLLLRDLRGLARRDASAVRFWLFFLVGSTVVGIVAHPYVVPAGVWNICGQSLTYLGLAYLAVRFRTLPWPLGVAGLLGCALDFAVGIFLQFRLENLPVLLVRSGDKLTVLPTGTGALSMWAFMNGYDKHKAGLDYVGDFVAALSPLLLWLLLLFFGLIAVRLTKILLPGLSRLQPTTASSSSVQHSAKT
jgi:hypothetical protein